MSKKIKIDSTLFTRIIISIVVLVGIILLCIFIPKSGAFNPDSTKSKYKNIENSEKLKIEYEKNGSKEKFLKDISYIQENISMYILNNNVEDEKTLGSVIKQINENIEKNKWDIIGIETPTYWVGSWKVDKKGTVKFSFVHKQAQPDWINDEDVTMHIVKK